MRTYHQRCTFHSPNGPVISACRHYTNDTGFDTTHGYNDVKKCRSVNKLLIDNFYWSFSNAKWILGRQRRAVFDINDVSGGIQGIQADNAMQSPAMAPPVGQSNHPVAVFNIQTAANAFTGFKLSGNLDAFAQLGTLPLAPPTMASPAYIMLEQPGVWSGSLAKLHIAGNYRSSKIGDLFEIGSIRYGITRRYQPRYNYAGSRSCAPGWINSRHASNWQLGSLRFSRNCARQSGFAPKLGRVC